MAQFDCHGREVTPGHPFAVLAPVEQPKDIVEAISHALGLTTSQEELLRLTAEDPEEFERRTGIDLFAFRVPVARPSHLIEGEPLNLSDEERAKLPDLKADGDLGEIRLGISEVGISDEAKAKASEVAALGAKEAIAAIAELTDEAVLAVLVNDSRKTVSEAAYARRTSIQQP